MMPASRPPVTITPIADEAGDVQHCEINVGGVVLIAPFTYDSSTLKAIFEDQFGFELTVDEVMTVTQASQDQLNRECNRLQVVLMELPAGSVARVVDTYYWLDADNGLLWDQYLVIGAEQGPEGRDISCIGPLDTEELWQIAEQVRDWLKSPQVITADPAWLLLD